MITLEQQKANRKLWVEALRSGRYEQGIGLLRSCRETYCCLGVLAEISGCEWEQADNLRAYSIDNGIGGRYTSVVSPAICDFVGLREYNGAWDASHALTSENDQGATFSEIADLIESEPPGLFVSES